MTSHEIGLILWWIGDSPEIGELLAVGMIVSEL